jgi:pilus assembly protein FimV
MRAAIAALMLSGASLSAEAAGLGRLTVLSNLGQPFRGEVDLVSVKKEEISSLTARLASPDSFRQADLPYTAYVSNLKLSIEQRPNGDRFVRVTASQPLNEPFVDFLVELAWNSGRLIRAYTALVDPAPVSDSAGGPGPAPGQAEVRQVVPETLPQAEVAPPSTPPANLPEAPAPAPRIQGAPERTTPQPAPAETPPGTPGKPMKQPRPRAATAPEKAESPEPVAGESVRVKKGDTLSRIARETRPEGVTLDQMLVLLYRDNPEAFVGRNMNRLRAGRVLHLPDSWEAGAVSPQEATKEVRLQSANWNAYRERLAGAAQAAAPAQEGPGRSSAGKVTTTLKESSPAPAEPAKDILKLSKGEPSRPSGPADAKAQDRARALEEEVAAKTKAASEANFRVAQLEKQVRDLQALVEMKSAAMADLQKSASAKPAAKAEPQKLPEPAKLPEPPKLPEPVKGPEPVAKAPEGPVKLPEGPAKLPEGTGKDAVQPLPPPPELPGPLPPVETAAPAAVTPPPPPKPRPKVALPPPPPPPSLLDELLGNPMIVAGGAAVAAALAGLGYLGWKRKRTAGERSGRPGGPVLEEVREDSFGPAGFDTPQEISDGTRGLPGGEAPAVERSDALAEAEVFMIYGRDAQAEERLKEAIAANPQRQELRAKLLEIYAKRNDRSAFEDTAKELQIATGGRGELWEKAVGLGYRIDPENPRYAAGRPADASLAKTQPGEMASTLQMNALDEIPIDDLDFNLDFETSSGQVGTDIDLGMGGSEYGSGGSTGTDIDLGAPAEGSGSDIFDPSRTISAEAFRELSSTVDSLDFDPTAAMAGEASHDLPTLPGVSLSQTGQERSVINFELTGTEATLGGTARAESPADDLGFDLDSFNLDTPDPDSDATRPGGLSSREDSNLTLPGGTGAELDLSSINLDLGAVENSGAVVKDERWYDIQTKFDLAKAYQEMGDQEGAREILEEVIAEGDDSQKQAARDLLEGLS